MNLNSKEARFSALMSPVKRVLFRLSLVNFNLVVCFFGTACDVLPEQCWNDYKIMRREICTDTCHPLINRTRERRKVSFI